MAQSSRSGARTGHRESTVDAASFGVVARLSCYSSLRAALMPVDGC